MLQTGRSIIHFLCIYYFAQVDAFKRTATAYDNLAIPDVAMVMGKSEFASSANSHST